MEVDCSFTVFEGRLAKEPFDLTVSAPKVTSEMIDESDTEEMYFLLIYVSNFMFAKDQR